MRRLRLPLDHMLACFRHGSYGWSVAAFVLASVTFSPFNTFYLHYAHATGILKSTLGTLTAAGYAVSILTAFGIGWLADRFGAVRVSAIVMAMYCVVSASRLHWRCGRERLSRVLRRARRHLRCLVHGVRLHAHGPVPTRQLRAVQFDQRPDGRLRHHLGQRPSRVRCSTCQAMTTG